MLVVVMLVALALASAVMSVAVGASAWLLGTAGLFLVSAFAFVLLRRDERS